MSKRKIAKVLNIAWSTVQYKTKKRKGKPIDELLEKRIHQLIQQFPRYGYRRITVMLKRLDQRIVNHKKVQRIMQRNHWGSKE